jgi:hypothetical protein
MNPITQPCSISLHASRPSASGAVRLCRAVGGLLPLLLVLAGCSVQGPVASPVPTDTVPPAATATPATPVTPAATPGGTVPAYAHAPDYSSLAGQVKQQGTCWVITYVSPLVDIAADQYNNQMSLLPGGGWDAATLKSGAWVIVQGQPQAGTDPAPGCPAHGYQVTSLAPNPNAPAAPSQ